MFRQCHSSTGDRRSLFFSVRADAVDYIDTDLHRLWWANKLNIVTIFTMYPANPKLMKTIGDTTISQNRWVYDLVTKEISPKRLTVSTRCGYPNAITRALPPLPKVYHILEPHTYPPTSFKKIKACKYHRYSDDHPELSTDDEDE